MIESSLPIQASSSGFIKPHGSILSKTVIKNDTKDTTDILGSRDVEELSIKPSQIQALKGLEKTGPGSISIQATDSSGIAAINQASSLAPPLAAPALIDSLGQLIVEMSDLKEGHPLHRNFRTSDGPFVEEIPNPPSREGLAELRESGSSQFSAQGLEDMKRQIPSGRLIVVDLREESHGFVDGNPISWRGEINWPNMGKSLKWINQDESQRLDGLRQSKGQNVKAQSEEEVCREAGAGYVRIPVTDYCRPEDRDVDQFLTFTASMPQDSWLHFHCKAGRGRTTTFMAMYDMMKNAKKVSLEDIVARQRLLNGVNLLAHKEQGDPKRLTSEMRGQFVKDFYDYCKSNDDGFKTTWTQWKNSQ